METKGVRDNLKNVPLKAEKLTFIETSSKWAVCILLCPCCREEVLSTKWMIKPAHCGRRWVLGTRSTQNLTATHQSPLCSTVQHSLHFNSNSTFRA